LGTDRSATSPCPPPGLSRSQRRRYRQLARSNDQRPRRRLRKIIDNRPALRVSLSRDIRAVPKGYKDARLYVRHGCVGRKMRRFVTSVIAPYRPLPDHYCLAAPRGVDSEIDAERQMISRMPACGTGFRIENGVRPWGGSVPVQG
jgi:hypothetical protein